MHYPAHVGLERCSTVCRILVALASLCPACTLGTLETELTVGACMDLADNDGDDLTDCEDPDCQRLERCRGMGAPEPPPGLVGDALPPITAPPGQDDVAMEPNAPSVGSAGNGVMGGPPPADGGTDPATDDAMDPMSMGAEDAPTCPLLCPEGQTCVNGRCVPNPFVIVDLWEITRIEVNVPRSIDYDNEVCLDTGCAVPVFVPPYLRCGCLPDPYVVVLVDGEEQARTSSARTIEFTGWDVSIPLGLLRTSVVRLEVLDDDSDEGEPDTLIYACEVPADPEVLAGGTIGCTEPFSSDTGPLSYTLSADVVPGS
ncbi:MAG: C2 domain-containing protein [Myxococcales bacterium]|nr:C2 domain-containing protein [Myxococcales bacterium]